MEIADQTILLALIFGLLGVCIVTRALDAGGLAAATVIGCIIGFMGHWTWLALLIFFLLSASIATRWKYNEKKSMGFAEANEGSRGWRNALANGGAPAIAVLMHEINGEPGWGALALSSSVAVALSDTLASEIGVMDSRTRSIITLRSVPTGSNGGMSPLGMFGSVIGAAMIAVAAIGLMADHLPGGLFQTAVIIATVGWIGCQIDSILGELLENRGLLGKHSVNFLATSFGALAGGIAYVAIF
jgi:uncharacterized protein (TIGR00297 family)